MLEHNPYEAPQETSRAARPARKAAGNTKLSGLTVAFVFQLVALVFMLINWVASELSPWGTDIRRHAWYAIISGALAAVIGIGMMIAAQRQQKSGWVLIEMMILGVPILGVLPMMIQQVIPRG